MGAFTSQSERLKGSRLGSYEIVSLIGKGAMASVFEGRHAGLGKPVAVKVLHEHLSGDEQVRSRFLREGRLAARLHHPNIVGVLDVGIEGDLPYLVMDLLTGQDLRTLLRDTHLLTLEHALGFVLPIASALAHAHDAGVIHRDLKPANIFLARDRRDDIIPTLVDFGLSKAHATGGTSNVTSSEVVAGTALYMAPEQTYGVRNSSAASDQYSLAVVLYECVTGDAPFRAESVNALIERIRSDAVRPPSMLNPRLPEELDALLLRALHRAPEKRFPNVRAFARALLPFASEETARAFARDFVDPSSSSASPAAPAARTEPEPPQPAAPTMPEEEAPSASMRIGSTELPCVPGASPFHIKGVAYRGLVQFVARAVPGGVDAFADSLGDDALADFVRQRFLAGSWYDILPLQHLTLTLTRLLGAPFEDFVRRSAATQARYDARTSFKAMWATPTLEGIALRVSRFMRQYYDFGTFSGSVPEANALTVVHSGVPEYIFAWYSPMHAAYTEECVRMLGAEGPLSSTQTASPAGERDGYPLVTSRLEIRWGGSRASRSGPP